MKTIEEYKEFIRQHKEDFEEYCHKKWVVMPTGTLAVEAWIDYWYEEISDECGTGTTES